MKFIIYSAPYDENVGGFIVLHKLCHLLNKTGHRAYLCPVGRKDRLLMQMKRNPSFTTPLLPCGIDLNPRRTVTIYPEVVEGNPIRGRNVVRWFLHRPGFHTGVIPSGTGEFHVGYGDFLDPMIYRSPGNVCSAHSLTIRHIPVEHYNLDGAVSLECRSGVAYCVRKAKLPELVGDLSDAECIDGKSHAEIAAIFKRVKYFFSFDPHTFYSRLAALCGAISIVIPTLEMSAENWYARAAEFRYGVGFGLEDEAWSLTSRPLLLDLLKREELMAEQSVLAFAVQVRQHFFAGRES